MDKLNYRNIILTIVIYLGLSSVLAAIHFEIVDKKYQHNFYIKFDKSLTSSTTFDLTFNLEKEIENNKKLLKILIHTSDYAIHGIPKKYMLSNSKGYHWRIENDEYVDKFFQYLDEDDIYQNVLKNQILVYERRYKDLGKIYNDFKTITHSKAFDTTEFVLIASNLYNNIKTIRKNIDKKLIYFEYEKRLLSKNFLSILDTYYGCFAVIFCVIIFFNRRILFKK